MKTILVYCAHNELNTQVLTLNPAHTHQQKLDQLQTAIDAINDENIVVAFGPQRFSLETVKRLLELNDMHIVQSVELKNCITDHTGMFLGEFGPHEFKSNEPQQEQKPQDQTPIEVTSDHEKVFALGVEYKVITRNAANWYEFGETTLERNVRDSIIELKQKELWQQLLTLLEIAKEDQEQE